MGLGRAVTDVALMLCLNAECHHPFVCHVGGFEWVREQPVASSTVGEG